MTPDWSENAALFERLMEIHSSPPVLYYGFNFLTMDYGNRTTEGSRYM